MAPLHKDFVFLQPNHLSPGLTASLRQMLSMLNQIKWLLRHPLGRRTPVRTLSRFAWWQIRQIINRQPYILDWVYGTKLEVIPHGGLTGHLYVGLPDYNEMCFFLRTLDESNIFVDVGANAGAFSVLALSQGCRVHAFEPVPSSFEKLTRNAELNARLGALQCHQKAVGSVSGTVKMTSDNDTGNHIVNDGNDSSFVEVPSTTLDEAFDCGRSIDNACFIKIDVEGFEWEVVQGAQSVLAASQTKALLIETFRPHNYGQEKLQKLEKNLKSHGFLPYSFSAEDNALSPLDHIHDGDNDTLYIRDVDWVNSRLMAMSSSTATHSTN